MLAVTAELDYEVVAKMLREVESGTTIALAGRSVLNASLAEMLADVVTNKMTGQYLGVRAGAARRSMQTAIVEFSGEQVVGALGSDLDYVRPHEQGFTGFVNIPGHVRRLLHPAFAKGAMTKGSRSTYRRRYKAWAKFQPSWKEHRIPTTADVRPHKRLMVIREKRFIRASLWEGVGNLEKRIVRALLFVIETGRAPTPSEIG